MDRQIVWNGAIPQDTDVLNTNKNAMIALAKLSAAVLGTGTLLNGLACTPTGPASMQVQVGPGEIYSLQNVDSSSYGSIAADTTHSVVKQGVLPDAVTLACAAPSTTGFSIDYLIQVTFQETDGGSFVLPYFNAANPLVTWSGPSNSGAPNYTIRQDKCVAAVCPTSGPMRQNWGFS